jgi:hypothetical protein
VKALLLKNEIDAASNLLSSLNLGTNDLNNLEWSGRIQPKQQQEVLDSDDDEHPLAILTSSNSVNQNKRIVKQLREDESERQLITAEDIKEAQEIANSPLHLDPVLEQVCQQENMEPPHRFLLYKPKTNSLNSSTSSLGQEETKKHRDNSSATPPMCTQGVKPLTIRESVEIEHKNRLKMKQLHEVQAADRLAAKMTALDMNGVHNIATNVPKPDASFMSKYRVASSALDDFEVEENDEDSLSDGDSE